MFSQCATKEGRKVMTEGNLNIVLMELGMSKVNTPACDQDFKWLNRFKNMKTMNESRFKFFGHLP